MGVITLSLKMKPDTTTSKTIPTERTIMAKRPCKNCGIEIYLQYIPITRKFRWISLDAQDGRLHDCPVKPLSPEIKRLIEVAIENNSSNNITSAYNMKVLHRIDRIIDDLKFIRQSIIVGPKTQSEVGIWSKSNLEVVGQER